MTPAVSGVSTGTSKVSFSSLHRRGSKTNGFCRQKSDSDAMYHIRFHPKLPLLAQTHHTC